VLFVIGCEEVATVRILAPSELAGAAVLVDGADWGVLVLQNGKATAEIAISPFADHELRIQRHDIRPIVRRLHYAGYGHFTDTIQENEIQLHRAARTS